jgi:hypothetical protein
MRAQNKYHLTFPNYLADCSKRIFLLNKVDSTEQSWQWDWKLNLLVTNSAKQIPSDNYKVNSSDWRLPRRPRPIDTVAIRDTIGVNNPAKTTITALRPKEHGSTKSAITPALSMSQGAARR